MKKDKKWFDDITWYYPAQIKRVIDGNTFVADVDWGAYNKWVDAKIRVKDLYCPELSEEEGLDAKWYAKTLLTPGDYVVIHTKKPDDFGRLLASVQLESGVDFATEMIAMGHGAVTKEKKVDAE